MNYEIHLDVYSGPMEMLLELIRKNKIDIYDIPIAFLADEFVKEMERTSISLDLMADFLVMAATLLEIKSKSLLPKKEEKEEEDPRQDLVRKIVEYRKFREIAMKLKEREDYESGSFYRKQEEFISSDDMDLLEDGNLEELTGVLRELLKKSAKREESFLEPMHPEYFPVSASIEKVRVMLLQREEFYFSELLSENPVREEIISLFLACLELSKFHEIRIDVEGVADFRIRRRDDE